MNRRFGESVRQNTKYRARPGAYVILPHAGDLLLTFQSKPDPELQLPGGGIDPGESAISALHREVLEETGWRIAAPRKLGTYRRFTYMPEYEFWAEKICHIFVARPVRRLSDPTEPFHTELWMSASDAQHALANTGDQHFLRRWLT